MSPVVAATLAVTLLGASAAAAPVHTSVVPDAASDECSASTWINKTPPALDLLQSSLAWSRTRGSGVVVAVVDSGVASANPHLSGAVVDGVDLVGDGAGPYADLDGHGTAIAGQIAARQSANSGVIGLAPEAKIMSVRVYAGTSSEQLKAGIGPNVDRLAAGIRYAADHGAQIINVSLSTSTDSPELDAAVAAATAQGSLVVASSGNRDLTLSFEENQADGPRWPAAARGALGVAAAGEDGVVGEASIHGPHVSVSAPGSNVLTTSAAGADCVFATQPATSFGAGYVSGAAALVAAAHRNESPAQWAYRLMATAVRADPDARDNVSGWGFVQPFDAIVLAPGAGIRGPESPFPSVTEAPDPSPTASPLSVVHTPPANAAALAWGVLGAVGTAVVLGVAGTMGVLRRRRAGAGEDAPVRRGGLFRDETPADEE